MLFVFAFFLLFSQVLFSTTETAEVNTATTEKEDVEYLLQLKEKINSTNDPAIEQQERFSHVITLLEDAKRDSFIENVIRLVVKQTRFLNDDENPFELAIYLAEKLSHNPNFTKILKRLRYFTPSYSGIRAAYKLEEYKKLLDHMESIGQKDLLIISRILHGMAQTGHVVISYTAFLEYIIFLQQHMKNHPIWCVKLLKSLKKNDTFSPDEFKTEAAKLLEKDTTERKEMLESPTTD